MSAVVSAISSVVESVVDAVGNVAEAVVKTAVKVVDTVVDTAEKVVDGALKDPIGTIAKVAAVATGQFELLPVISAADTVANGGSLKDAALSAGVAYFAPTVTAGVGDALADTAIGDALSSTSDVLPGAVSKGVGTAALNTAAGVLKGQDLETALAGGVTAGIGAGVGNAVTSNLAGSDYDTGNKGINTLLGNAAGAATTAELRGKDVSTAVANSLAPGILGLGAGAVYDSAKVVPSTTYEGQYWLLDKNGNIASVGDDFNGLNAMAQAMNGENQPKGENAPAGLTTLLASNAPGADVVSDSEDPNAALLTALQNNAQVEPNDVGTEQLVNVLYPNAQFDTNQKGEIALPETTDQKAPTESNGLISLGNGIYMTPSGNFVDEAGYPVNAMGQRTDSLGNVIGDATTSPVSSSDVSGTPLSNLVATTTGGASAYQGLAGTLGDQEGDFPISIENLPDGSTKVNESDGSYKIFNVDGSIDTFDADGNPTNLEVVASKDKTDPLGDFIDTLGVDKVNVATTDANDAAGTGQGAVSEPAPPPKEIVDPDRSGTNLTGLVNSLIPNVIKPAVNWVTNHPVASVIGAGALTGALSGDQSTQGVDNTNVGGYGFDWGLNMGAGPRNGIYYGTQMLNPTWTKHAAEGGLMKPQFIQPTLGENGIQMSEGGDPTNSVTMYAAGGPTMSSNALVFQAAQQSGLSTDPQTLSKLVALVNQGYSVEQAAQVLQSHQMASGGIASLGHYSDGGRFLKGPGDGMSDDIPATIAGKQPARLANEEFVIPADVVSHLGNGSSEAGSKVLYDMMDKVRKARTGTTKQGKQIDPHKFMPKTRG